MKKPTLSSLDKKLDIILKLLGNPVTDVDLIELKMTSKMTVQYLFDECKKLFDIYSYIDLSKIVSERKGNYTVCFKNVQEADEENKNLSANELKEKGVKGITLEERLLLEILYFKKTGKHLDIDNLTLCAGSRHHDGHVPCVDWSSDNRQVNVDWYNPDDSNDNVRSRSVVSLKK